MSVISPQVTLDRVVFLPISQTIPIWIACIIITVYRIERPFSSKTDHLAWYASHPSGMPSESVSEDTGSEEPTSSSVMPVNRLITSVLARFQMNPGIAYSIES